jgi:signal transduction histidine kinase
MCILIIDTDGRIITAGSDAAAFTGPAAITAVGRSFLDFVAPEFAALCHEALSIARAGATQVVEFRAADHHDRASVDGPTNGTRWRATLAPFATSPDSTSIAAIVCPLPPVALQKDQLVAGAVRGIAHDLNNVLTVVVGLNGLLATGSDAERRELYTTEIGRAADKATQLAAELAAFGKPANEDVRVFGINALLLELEPMLRRLIPPSIELSAATSESVDPVRVNRSVVESMVIDLVVNAVQAMQDGGRVVVRTYPHSLPSTLSGLPAERATAGRYTVLETRAEGDGASGVAVPAAVRAAAVDCGAWMTAASTADIGAIVQIYFPVAARIDTSDRG